jgi:SOS-response transcriptional repressor LexA
VRQPIPNEAQAEQRLRLGYGFLAIGEKIFDRVQKEGRVQRLGAYGDRIPPKENVSLSQVEVEDILLAPLAWCPHPENMISMYLEGDSMYPVIPPESIIFVDTASTKRERLHQRLTVVSHRDLGFKVARFQRLSGSDLLVSANHKYVPVDVSSASKWKIFGEVLWWVSRDAEPKA